MKDEICPVCGCSMHLGLKPWHWQCQDCEYEKADFEPAINEPNAHQKVDEHDREIGLRSLRISNFRKLFNVIIEKGSATGSLLDVGCAHGWFMDIASTKFSTLGIEPDAKVYNETKRRGVHVRQGFFPNVLEKEECFDVIVFNDVFEHIPDVKETLASCKAHMLPNGLLVLNLPGSGGYFYKISRVLCKLGVASFFERLWQKDLPSPHLHYFNIKNLSQLLRSNGFEVVDIGILPSVSLQGLYTRISHTGSYYLPARLVIFFIVMLTLPILRILPADIIYVVSRKV